MSTNLLWDIYPAKSFEYISKTFASEIAERDNTSKDPKFVERNCNAYWFTINAWFNYLNDLGLSDIRLLVTKCLRDGQSLYFILSRIKGVCLPILRDPHNVCEKIAQTWPELAACVITHDCTSSDTIFTILCGLRFATRFTLPYNDSVKVSTLEKFLKVDKELLWSKSPAGHPDPNPFPSDNWEVEHAYLIGWMKEIWAELEGEAGYLVRWHCLSDYRYPVSSGAVTDACNCTFCKQLVLHTLRRPMDIWKEGAEWEIPNSEFFNPYTPVLMVSEQVHKAKYYPRSHAGYQTQLAGPASSVIKNFILGNANSKGYKLTHAWSTTPNTVPKNAEEGRVIAKTSVIQYAFAKQWFNRHGEDLLNAVETAWHGSIPLHDQSVNQELARIGSITGDIATLDASGGSDRIKKRVIYTIVSNELSIPLRNITDTFINVKGEARLCHMLATSGNPVTFLMESLFYGSIVELAYRILMVFSGYDDLIPWSVYGDDVVCDSRAVSLLEQLYPVFGLKINMDKSYWEGPGYRESCGAEWLCGQNMRGLYMSRKPWAGKPEQLLSLYEDAVASLSHLELTNSRLIGFVRHAIKGEYPKVTFIPDEIASHYSFRGEQTSYDAVTFNDDGTASRTKVTSDEALTNPRIRVVETCLVTKRRTMKVNKLCICNLMDDTQRRLWWDYFSYQEFLRTGPQYEDSLMELLHISTPRMTYDQARCEEELAFKRRR